MKHKIALALSVVLFAGSAIAQQQVNLPGLTVITPSQSGFAQPGFSQPGLMPITPGASMQNQAVPGQVQPDAQAAVAPVMPRGIPNANQQGAGDRGESALAAARAQADWEAMNTPRQRGEVVYVPTLANPVAKQAQHQAWLQDWTMHLQSLGVSSEKVAFEANRLSQKDFARWASRQVFARRHDQVLAHQPALGKNEAEVFPIQ